MGHFARQMAVKSAKTPSVEQRHETFNKSYRLCWRFSPMIAAWRGQTVASRRFRMPVNALSIAHLPVDWQLSVCSTFR